MNRYLLATAAVVGALGCSMVCQSLLHNSLSLLWAFGAVVVTTRYSGVRPGMTAAVLVVLVSTLMSLRPGGHPMPIATWLTAVLIFYVESCMVIALAQGLRRSRDTAAQSLAALQCEQEQHSLADERLRLLVEVVQDYAIFMVGVDGKIATWNAGAERILGYRQEEAVGMSVARLYGGGPEDTVTEELGCAQENGCYVGEGWRFRKDGGQLWASVVTTAIRQDAEVTGFVKILRDITAAKQAEQERHTLLVREQQARQRAEQAVRELQETQAALEARNALLAQADRAKDQFLAMLGHELRNPLAPIDAVVHLLRRQLSDNPQAQARVAVIERQVKRMARLVDDLLDVSRITRGKIFLKKETLVLQDVLDQAIETVRPALNAARHTLFTTISPMPIPVYGDEARLEQIFTNLLGNAIKYTPAGGEVHVGLEAREGKAWLRIRDTGIGITEAGLPQIFDLFAQGDRALDRAEGGLGIGLTLVKGLLAMHGGAVSATSEGPGKGAEFLVELPIPEIVGRPTLEPGLAVQSVSRRVLIVEDNVDAALVLADVVGEWGHTTEVAHDGPTAVAIAAQFQPDVVFLDIGLPGMDGYEVARRLRQDAQSPSRLVALTGYGQEEDRQRALRAGFDDHLTKPASIERLAEILAEEEVPCTSPVS